MVPEDGASGTRTENTAAAPDPEITDFEAALANMSRELYAGDAALLNVDERIAASARALAVGCAGDAIEAELQRAQEILYADRNTQARRRLDNSAPTNAAPIGLRPRRQSPVELRLHKAYSEAVDGDGATPGNIPPPAPDAQATGNAPAARTPFRTDAYWRTVIVTTERLRRPKRAPTWFQSR